MEKPSLKKAVQIGMHLLCRGKYTLTFDQLKFPLTDLTWRKRLNFILQGMQLMVRSVNRIGFPPIVQIEPTNCCNLQCPMCPTGSGLMDRSPSFMPFELYCRVIDQLRDHVCLVVFWSWGEPFFHKEALRMIRYAKDCNLLVHTSTNGHFFTTRERAREVIESGLDSIIVAVDGLDQRTYEQYRKGGKLKQVIESIENLVAERSSAKSQHPFITLRFIVMRHNEHQIGRVKDFAEQLGVDTVTFRSAVIERGDINLESTLTPFSEEFQQYDYRGLPGEESRVRRYTSYCHRPYANLTIFSNGDVVPCENDYNATFTFGNVSDQNLQSIFSSVKAKAFFKTFRNDLNSLSFCQMCENRDIKHPTANVQTVYLKRNSSDEKDT
jgi:radical SAM protein with 4Fe4S-binding SPASM domain